MSLSAAMTLELEEQQRALAREVIRKTHYSEAWALVEAGLHWDAEQLVYQGERWVERFLKSQGAIDAAARLSSLIGNLCP